MAFGFPNPASRDLPGLTAKPGGSGLRVEILSDPAAIDDIRADWLALRPHRDAHPDFFRLILTVLPQVVAPLLVTLRTEEGALQALLVGRLDRATPPARLGHLKIPVPPLLTLNIVHGGVLGRIDPAEGFMLSEALQALLRSNVCDALFLHEAPAEHPLIQLVGARPGWTPQGLPGPHHFLQLPPGSPVFPATLSKNERYNQRRRERKLFDDNDGQVQILAFHMAADVPDLMAKAEQVAATSYQRALGVGFEHSPAMQRRLTGCAELGWLRAWVLLLRGQPAAFWITTLQGGTLVSDFLSFDLAHARHSPGMYLSLATIAQCQTECPAGLIVDFGPGAADYKARLSTHTETTTSLYRFGVKPRPLLTRSIVGAAAIADRVGRVVVRRLGLFDTLRRWFRRKRPEAPIG